MIIVLLCLLAAALLTLGFEMLVVIGLPSLIAWQSFFPTIPTFIIPQKMVAGVNVSTTLAIPFFIFAADLMSRGTIAARLTELMKANLGHLRGGIGHTATASCMAFGSVCGSAPGTVAALGRILHPELTRAGYSDRFSLGLIAASSECALLIPPSITLLIYGWLTGTSIAALFEAGLVIGLVLGISFMGLVLLETARRGATPAPKASRRERLQALKAGSLAIGMPVVVLGGIYGGVFTATEAAAVSVAYALLVEVGIYRSFGWREVFRIAEASAITVTAVFILLSVGTLMSYFITLARVPDTLIAFITAMDVNWVTFLLIVNVVLLVAGMFVDPNSILLVLVPALFPVATALGIHPVHFGVVVCLNICIGMITPPFGLDLFVASSTLRRPVETIISGITPFILVNLAVLGLISYVPWLSTAVLALTGH